MTKKIRLGIAGNDEDGWWIITADTDNRITGHFEPAFSTNGEALWRIQNLADELFEGGAAGSRTISEGDAPERIYLPVNMPARGLTYVPAEEDR